MSRNGFSRTGFVCACLLTSGLFAAFACGGPTRKFQSIQAGSGGVAAELPGGAAGGPDATDAAGTGFGAPIGGANGGALGSDAGAGGFPGTICESGETRCSSAEVLQTCAEDGTGFVDQEACTGTTPTCDAGAGRCVGCESCDATTQVCKNNKCECAKSYTGPDCSVPRFELIGSSIDYGYGVGVSQDGAVIAGTTYDLNEAYSGFIWTNTDGPETLKAVKAANEGSLEPTGISKNGQVIVGTFDVSPVRAFRWTSAGKAVDLGVLPGGSASYGYAASADGSVVIGISDGTPFRWTSSGMVAIPMGAGGPNGDAAAVSDDGSVVVGTVAVAGKATAYRWKVGDSAPTPLGSFVGSTTSTARGVSGNGLVVVGDAESKRAFRWSSGTGFVGIADSLSATVCLAKATNIDGTVVVGYSDTGAWVWDSASGISMIKTIVSSLGFSTDGYDLRTLNAISSDGKTVVGGTSTPSGIDRTFVVRLP
jgi:probable HAF family extracellular repeat protein